MRKLCSSLVIPPSGLLTQSHVLAELVALALIRPFPRTKVLEFVVDLVDNPDIETVWVDEQLHRDAMQLLRTRQDKGYSLCDAVGFILDVPARDNR